MAKRVIVIVLLLVVALFAYVGYHSYDAKRVSTNGEVYSNGAVRKAPPEPRDRDQPNEPDAIVYPTGTANGGNTAQPAGTPQETVQAPAAVPQQQLTQNQQPVAANAPATDTISPNPPNGMAFAGSGRFQLYRQGNITWRLDTDTGRTCIIFATDEEWRKPKVYRAGCGSK